MDTDALEEAVKDSVSKGAQPKLIYTIGVYQNPMGMTLSAERRRHMLEISQTYGIPILENESYADFRIDGDPLPPAIYGMDGDDGVMYVSAYTKLLGCGLRLGFGVRAGRGEGGVRTSWRGAESSDLDGGVRVSATEWRRVHRGGRAVSGREARRDACGAGRTFPAVLRVEQSERWDDAVGQAAGGREHMGRIGSCDGSGREVQSGRGVQGGQVSAQLYAVDSTATTAPPRSRRESRFWPGCSKGRVCLTVVRR